MRRQEFLFLFAAVMFFVAFVATLGNCNGQEITLDDGTPLRGEGWRGVPPSYLTVVKVETGHSGGWAGSGAFLSDRLVLTCYHNVRGVENGDRVGIHTTNGLVYWNTRVTHQSPEYDLALIYIDEPIVFYHRVVRVMDTVYPLRDVSAMGFSPRKNALTIVGGKPTGRRFGESGVRGPVTFEHSARIVQGMSGGPLIDSSLCVVGVNVNCGRPGDVDTLSVSLHRIHEFLDSYEGPVGNMDNNPFDFRDR